jgi:hypothetical protein
MDWGGAYVGNGATTQVGVGWIFPPTIVQGDYVDPTLMALRMDFTYRINAASPGHVIGVGVLAWDSRNDTIPATVPLPISDPQLDWIIVARSSIPSGTPTGTTVFYHNENAVNTYSKARRRLGNQTGLLYVFEIAPGASVNINYTVSFRFLIKE